MANVKGALKLLNGMAKTADNVVSSSATTKGAVKLLNSAARQADEVVESTVKKSSNQLIKAGGNYLESNKSTAQRTAQNMSTTVRRGADAANDVVNARTTVNSSVPEVSGVPATSRRRTRRINGDVSDVPSAQDTSTKIIGEGTSRGGGFDTSNAIDLDPIEVGPNQRVERRSNRRGNNTQQPETPKVIYSGQGDNPNVIYADGPTAAGGGGGSGNNGGGSSTSSSSNANGGRSKGNRMKGNTRLSSDRLNEFGNQAKDFFLGGSIDSYNNYKSGMGVIDSVVKAHQNEDGSVNMMKAAGTFMTMSAAARVASGGGVYKDRYGNPNLIGVPFI